jgi:hypothetical protein
VPPETLVRDDVGTDLSVDPRRAAVARLGLALTVAGSATALLRGPHGSLAPNIALLSVAFAGFATVVWAGREPGVLNRRVIIGLSGALLTLAVVIPPTQSADVWSYTMYGRMVSEYHENPFTHTPADHPLDPLAHRVSGTWFDTPSVYGPVWVALSAPGTAIAGDSALVARLYFELFAAVSIVAAMAIVWRETDGSPLALALLGVNPFVIISVVNGAHNDATVGLLVLGAVLLAQRARWRWCGALLAAAIAIKVAAGLVVPALVLWAWRWKGRRAGLTLAAWAIGCTALIYGVGGGFTGLLPLAKASSQVSRSTIWQPLADISSLYRAPSTRLISGIAELSTLLFAGFLAFRYRAKSHPALVVGLAVLAYGLAASYVLPWYLAWGMVPLALCYRSRTALAMLVLSALLTISTIPDPHRGIFVIPRQTSPAKAVQTFYTNWSLPLVELAALILVVLWATTDLQAWLGRRWSARRDGLGSETSV